MKNTILIFFTIGLFVSFVSGCGEDNVSPLNNQQDEYVKVASAESGNVKFEIWTTGNDTLMTGYNKVGFKVYENGQPKTSGSVKFYAKMFHFSSTDFHATPVEPEYLYDNSLGMFTGYIIMLMPSDTSSRWYGFYSYNDILRVDSSRFDVGWDNLTKFKIFTDLNTNLSYLITMTSPVLPVRGYNDFICLLHESPDFLSFTQVNTASMFLRVRLDSLNYTSSDNINPVYTGGGFYKGRVNFDYSGGWKVYDSIYYNNTNITNFGTPYIYYNVP